jgi:hypothetical protein
MWVSEGVGDLLVGLDHDDVDPRSLDAPTNGTVGELAKGAAGWDR